MKNVTNSIIAGALVAGMTLSVSVLAEQGTIIAVEEDTVFIKGSDGSTYEFTGVAVEAEDFETGDTVEFEVVEERVLSVEKM